MNRQKRMIKLGTGLCMAAAAVLLCGEGALARAATPAVSTGLAGISLYIDRFYENYTGEDAAVMLAAAGEGDAAARTAQTEQVEEPVSEYENVGISIASNYVNIRQKPTTESEVVGKLYQGCAATILKREDDWVKIKSGNAKGYINADYLAIGFDAEELVEQYATRWAVVNTETLRVRMEPSTEARIATLVPMGEKLLVTDVEDDWVKISMDNGDITGFVAADYVDIEVEFKHAVTIEEEQAEIRRKQEAEETLRRQQEEQRKKEQAAQQQASQQTGQNSSASNNSNNSSFSSNSSNESASDLALSIVSFAKKFVGNPYVYGGTSLTNGADCSGFVQSVYKNFGITIPRDSRSQCAGAGYKVSLDSVKPGDLIFYTNSSGTVNHVAMYIGNGQIVHASDPSSGIRIQNMRYRTPYMAKRIID